MPLDEPERANAIHGLVRWLAWTCVEQSASAVRLQCVLEPQPAYHWRLRSGRDLIAIDPGGQWTGEWGLDPT